MNNHIYTLLLWAINSALWTLWVLQFLSIQASVLLRQQSGVVVLLRSVALFTCEPFLAVLSGANTRLQLTQWTLQIVFRAIRLKTTVCIKSWRFEFLLLWSLWFEKQASELHISDCSLPPKPIYNFMCWLLMNLPVTWYQSACLPMLYTLLFK